MKPGATALGVQAREPWNCPRGNGDARSWPDRCEGPVMILCFCCERRSAPQPADLSECGCMAMYCTICRCCATHCRCADALPPDALLQPKLDESLEELDWSI